MPIVNHGAHETITTKFTMSTKNQHVFFVILVVFVLHATARASSRIRTAVSA